MAVYAIGDVQGCHDQLRALLERLRFDPLRDRLWLVGDLVNRGPKSLETLRFVRSLGEAAVTVLGNHDLHLIALHAGVAHGKADAGLQAVLQAPDAAELLHWLRHRPLMHHDAALGWSMLHAGLPPQWDLAAALACAAEAETLLRSPGHADFLPQMYGDQPNLWSEFLHGAERIRFIINAFTRMRFCDAEGRLDFAQKGPPGSQPTGLYAWYEAPGRQSAGHALVVGHWSTLDVGAHRQVLALDSGCAWGRSLTAARLDRKPAELTSIPCPPRTKPSGAD